MTIPKPVYFQDHRDSTIYQIKVMGAYTIGDDGKPTLKGLGTPGNIDIWFFLQIFNEGKIRGRFISRDTHAYLIDLEIKKYYFLVNWLDHHWFHISPMNVEDLTLGTYPFVRYPTLGIKNTTKIKKAIKDFLRTV